MKIAVITPVRHLEGIEELLRTKGDIFYLEEGSKLEVRDLLLNQKIDIIVCNPNQQTYTIDKDLLHGSKVSLINTCSTGTNHIDLQYCKKKNIKIYSLTEDYELLNNLPSTAELSFGLLLDLMRNITNANNEVKQNKTWNYLPFIGNQMKGSKVGIVGYGRLGKMMANYCKAFEAEVFIYDPFSNESNVKNLEELFKVCDAVSLHVHVNDKTRYMIDYKLLCHNVKYLVNTSRGEIVNEISIIKALKENKLKGYAADVLESEFDDIKNSPLLQLKNLNLNCILTPHVGGMTIQGQTKAYKWAINKL